MSAIAIRASLAGMALAGAFALVVGCGPVATPTDSGKGTEKASATEKKPHDHGGWWCDEHGIPEHECSRCLPAKKVQTMFKDNNDWCDKHDRAKSQCFICDPTLKDKFAAKYRAKYGGEPPPIGEEEDKKDDKK